MPSELEVTAPVGVVVGCPRVVVDADVVVGWVVDVVAAVVVDESAVVVLSALDVGAAVEDAMLDEITAVPVALVADEELERLEPSHPASVTTTTLAQRQIRCAMDARVRAMPHLRLGRASTPARRDGLEIPPIAVASRVDSIARHTRPRRLPWRATTTRGDRTPARRHRCGWRLVMFHHIVVPLDGSERSWTAVDIADQLAVACDADLELVHVVDPATGERDEHQLRQQLKGHKLRTPSAQLTVLPVSTSVASTIADHYLGLESAGLVMSSAGRGRSEAVLGSVAQEVLAQTFGPLVIVGPDCQPVWRAGGAPLIIPVDTSELSETSLGLGTAWGVALELTPWVVWVSEPDVELPHDVAESSYPSSLAARMSSMAHREIEFEVLHGSDPAEAITNFAKQNDAALIVASTHGRTGLQRLLMGSVAAAIVKHAGCPVVLSRPPQLIDTSAVDRRAGRRGS